MGTIGIGIDLVHIPRMEGVAHRWGGRFLQRVFTERERIYCLGHRRPAPHLASRFAVKEAVIKALGLTRDDPFCWREIETLNDASGKPQVCLTGQIGGYADARGVRRVHVSITHDHHYAIAQVVLEGA